MFAKQFLLLLFLLLLVSSSSSSFYSSFPLKLGQLIILLCFGLCMRFLSKQKIIYLQKFLQHNAIIFLLAIIIRVHVSALRICMRIALHRKRVELLLVASLYCVIGNSTNYIYLCHLCLLYRVVVYNSA